MKGFLRLLLVAAISVSMSACGDKAKEPTPEEKAAQYADSIFKAIEDSDFDQLDVISEDLNGYIRSIDESQGEAFGEEFAEQIYRYSEKYGYGEDFADSFLAACRRVLGGEGLTPPQYPAAFLPDTYEFYWTESPDRIVERLWSYRNRIGRGVVSLRPSQPALPRAAALTAEISCRCRYKRYAFAVRPRLSARTARRATDAAGYGSCRRCFRNA